MRGLPQGPSSSDSEEGSILVLGRLEESLSATVGGRLRLRFGVLDAGSAGFTVMARQRSPAIVGRQNQRIRMLPNC